jgi:hypothetical protein
MCPRVPSAFLIALLVVLSPSSLLASKLLVITGGDPSNDAALLSVLQSQGNSVTLGPTYTSFTGAGLSGYNAVVLIPNGYENTADMPTSGQQALVDYVRSGGGLVTGEPVISLWTYPGDFKTLAQVFPAQMGGANTVNSPLVFTALSNDPVMTAKLPSTFSIAATPGTDSETYIFPTKSNSAISGATAFYSTNQWPLSAVSYNSLLEAGVGIVGGSFGLGRVINMSTASDNTSLGNANYDQLLVNSINWVTGSTEGTAQPFPPIPSPVPEPTTLEVFSLAAIGLAVRSRLRSR